MFFWSGTFHSDPGDVITPSARSGVGHQVMSSERPRNETPLVGTVRSEAIPKLLSNSLTSRVTSRLSERRRPLASRP